MRKLWAFALVILPCCACASNTLGKADFQRCYDRLSRAFEQKDEPAFLSFMTPDFRQIQTGKPDVSRSIIAASFRKTTALMSNVRWTRKVDKVSHLGGRYEVTVEGKLSSTIRDGKGKAHSYVLTGTSIDFWNPAMKMFLARVLSISVVMDGKVMTIR